MKNIFIEGIQGMGKSTLLQAIASKYPEYMVCREGDYSPVELAWCAWLTEEEYEGVLSRYDAIQDEIKKNTVVEKIDVKKIDKDSCEQGNSISFKEQEQIDALHYIVCYTKIITDIPEFHKDLEQYEIYNGRKTLEEMQEIILARYERFFAYSGSQPKGDIAEKYAEEYKDTPMKKGYLFECSFLQNIVEDLILFHQLSDDEIVDFYKKLYEKVDKEKFTLLYLYSDNLEETTNVIKKERSDGQGNEMWYPLMLEYLVNSPYGKAHGYKEFEDMINHFRHRQRVELRIIEEVVGENAMIIPAKEWNEKL